MHSYPRTAQWQPGHLICAAGAMAGHYTAVPVTEIENVQQLTAVHVSTAWLMVFMSSDYQPPKVKK